MDGQQECRRVLVFLGEVKAIISSLFKKTNNKTTKGRKNKKEPTLQTF